MLPCYPNNTCLLRLDPPNSRFLLLSTRFSSLVQFPEHPYGDLLDKVLLYRHSNDDVLLPLGAEDPIEDGSIIEIILTGR